MDVSPSGTIEPLQHHPLVCPATQDRLDGLTVDFGSWWFNLRPSNTEPLLRLNLEAYNDADMQRHRDEVLELIRS